MMALSAVVGAWECGPVVALVAVGPSAAQQVDPVPGCWVDSEPIPGCAACGITVPPPAPCGVGSCQPVVIISQSSETEARRSSAGLKEHQNDGVHTCVIQWQRCEEGVCVKVNGPQSSRTVRWKAAGEPCP